MNKGLSIPFFIVSVLFLFVPLICYCQNVNVIKTTTNSNAADSTGGASNIVPPIVQDTSASFKQIHTGNELTKIDNKNDLIYLNTIDGLMYAVSKNDGKIKWSLEEEAVLKFPENYKDPYFLTDPRDGSLYIFTTNPEDENHGRDLKKFPYTIAELVSASPSKSSDGFLYTGDKKDQWLAIDYRTGAKLDTLTAETLSSKISIADDNVIFIGRTQYTITMFDISTRRKIFNLTYYDYSTHAHASKQHPRPMTANMNDQDKRQQEDLNRRAYPYYHFTSSSDGTIVTLDKRTGDLIWKLKLKSPVIAMYRYESEQLFKIKFAIYSAEALSNLTPDNRRLLYNEQKYQDIQNENGNLFQKPGQSSKPTVGAGSDSSGQFVSTLYIGFHNNNLYALPSFVYSSQFSLTGQPLPLLTGEQANETTTPAPSDGTNPPPTSGSLIDPAETVPIGHHRLPEKFEPPPDYIQPNDKLIVISSANRDEMKQKEVAELVELFSGTKQSCPAEPKKSRRKQAIEKIASIWRVFDDLMGNKYFWTIFTVLLGSIPPLAKTYYDRRRRRREKLRRLAEKQDSSRNNGTILEEDDINSSSSESGIDEDERRYTNRTTSSGGSKTRNSSSKHSNSSQKRGSTNHMNDHSGHLHPSQSAPAELGQLIQVGKITYDPLTRLGHGCSGTIVYKGTFESRPVAVKRLLPECYTLADREVSLLRDADQHPNVLRYFCTESDSQFRYIALELCQMTLADYVHQQFNLKFPPKNELRILNILEQATCGLDHLHSLDIVHRDIKPQNVLISFPDQKGRAFVMISDFGLCKRLEVGNNSFSKRSGILGTEGWIAPEVLDDLAGAVREQFEQVEADNNNPDNPVQDVKFGTGNEEENKEQQQVQPKRITKSVDIFSLGCVYYFVLSGGSHPFGDSIMRQANILQNQYKLDKLSNTNCEIYMQRVLIEKMISNDPKKRPTTKEILSSPVFWTKAKILQFLQDVSDRIEKLEPTDPILVELEKGASAIIRNNWKVHICPHLQNDLKRYRTYNGVCLRDLLRAIRNKKHHYRELPPEVMQSLGSLPDEFVDYFINRFPKLINHVYDVMKCCSNESMLDVYYHYMEHRY